jgi:hypothetical protein
MDFPVRVGEGGWGHAGAPHVEFLKAMRAEHCTKAGSATPFTSLNYCVTTTPALEWAYVVDRAPCPLEDMGHDRRIPDVDELRQLQVAKDARLRRFEILAVVLYTGPMVRGSRAAAAAAAAATRGPACAARARLLLLLLQLHGAHGARLARGCCHAAWPACLSGRCHGLISMCHGGGRGHGASSSLPLPRVFGTPPARARFLACIIF